MHRTQAVSVYLASPGGQATSADVAHQLLTLPLEPFGLSETPTQAQLHRLRLELERLRVERSERDHAENTGVRPCPTDRLRKTQPEWHPANCFFVMHKVL